MKRCDQSEEILNHDIEKCEECGEEVEEYNVSSKTNEKKRKENIREGCVLLALGILFTLLVFLFCKTLPDGNIYFVKPNQSIWSVTISQRIPLGLYYTLVGAGICVVFWGVACLFRVLQGEGDDLNNSVQKEGDAAISEIEKAKNLLDSGAITEKEYYKIKRNVLDKLQ